MSEITLFKGDCLIEMNKIVDKSVDMILCDLPYGTTACKWDSVIPFEPLWEQYNRVIKDNGAIVLFGSEPFSSALRMSNLKMYKYDWKWDKIEGSGFINAKIKPLNCYEDIMVFGKQKINYYPIMVDRLLKNERNRFNDNTNTFCNVYGVKKINISTVGKQKYPINKIVFNRLSGDLNTHNILHPTQKPVAILEYLIKTYTLENETVLDNCMGSGSTGVACINTNRNFIGIEKDDKYFEIAKNRIEKCQKSIFDL